MIIGQERPEGMPNKFREYLFKKSATGDGIFGRLPYQVLTKVINLVGWKRMETNRLPTFDGVTEGSYNSLYRRWCHIQHAGKFFDKKYITKNMEEGKTWGYFEKRHDLKYFMQAKPATLAELISQWKFMRQNSMQDCHDKIDNYAFRGGDCGIGDKSLRKACGLPHVSKQHDTIKPDGGEVQIVLPKGVDLGLFPGDSEETNKATAFAVLKHDVVKFMLHKNGRHITRLV